MQQMVSDETWSRLDPYQGALTTRQRLRAAGVVAVLAVLAALGWMVWTSGLLRPHLAFADRYSRSTVDTGKHTFTLTLLLVNEGAGTEHLSAIGRSGPGLRLVKVEPALLTMKASEEKEISLTYQVTDCARADVPARDWPVPITATRPGPDPTVGVQPASRTPLSDTDLDAGSYELPWQLAMVKDACSTGAGSRLSGSSD